MNDVETFEQLNRPKSLFGKKKYFPTEQRRLYGAGNNLSEAVIQYNPSMIPLKKKIAPCSDWWTYISGKKHRINVIKRNLKEAKEKLSDIGV